MMDYSQQQVIHDEVNLSQLVRRLEKSALYKEDWDEHQEQTWLKALGILQKVKHGRKLLLNVEQYDSPEKTQKRNDIRAKLNRIESFMVEVQKRTMPVPARCDPILPRIPVPSPSVHIPGSSSNNADIVPVRHEALNEPMDATPSQDSATSDAPSSPPATSDLLYPESSLLPATPIIQQSRVTASSTAVDSFPSRGLSSRKHLQASSVLHEELTTQLAQMATQLKRNALHFSDSLDRDKAVLEETEEKLEGNLTVMSKERVRLRDHRGKSWSTTWLVIGIVVIVIVLFMFVIFAIRISAR